MKKKISPRALPVLLKELPKGLDVEIFASGPRNENAPKLGHVDLDFGREDLNQLKNKINEVIDHLNAFE